LIACAIFFGASPISYAAEPDPPLLMLNSGGHLALATALEFTLDGRHLVVGSEDKVIRIWNTSTDELTRTLRGQAGQGSYGAIKAIALSSDGRWLAAGGSFGPAGSNEVGDIRLYDLSTGQIEKLLKGHADAVTALRFSSDGRYLASGSWDKQTIIWDIETGKQTRTYAHSHVVTAVNFSADGRFALSAAQDEPVSVWDVKEDRPMPKLEGHTETVRAISVSPASGTIATASFDGTILLWTPDALQRVGKIDLQAYSIQAASFCDDGRLAVAFWRGGADQLSAVSVLVDPGTGKILAESSDLGGVRASAVNRSCDQVAVGGGMWGDAIQVWHPKGDRGAHTLRGSGRPIWSVDFSKDGQYVAWGTKYERWSANKYGPLEFRMQLPNATGELGPPEPIGDQAGGFLGPSVRAAEIQADLESSDDGPDRIWNMDRLKITSPAGSTVIDWTNDALHGQRHQAFALDREGKVVVTAGANGAIAAYRTDGTALGSFEGHAGYVWAVAISPDNRLLATGGDDETVRIWNLQTRKLIVSIFRAEDGKGDWVVWTPAGYYTSSSDGDKYVGWQVNRGGQEIPSYFTAKQLRERLFKPEIINRALILGSAEQAVEDAKKQNPNEMDFDIAVLMRQTPPSVKVLSPAGGTDVFGSSEIVVTAQVWDTDPGQLPDILAYVNRAALERSRISVAPSGGRFDVNIAVPLDEGPNDVRIVARNAIGETPFELSIFNNSSTDQRPGTLFAVIVGVDLYPDLTTCPFSNGCNLQFAGNDAVEFEKVLQTKVAPRYRSYRPALFRNASASFHNGSALQATPTQEPTASRVLTALNMFTSATSKDTVLVFFSGHGLKARDGKYQLFTSDSQFDSNQGKYANYLSWSEVFDIVRKASGRKLIFLDSCKSGMSFNAGVAKTKDDGIDTFASTYSNKPSREYQGLYHGAFTAAILTGLRDGRAAFPPSTEIDTLSLAGFLDREVRRLTGEDQRPSTSLVDTPLLLAK
jgi:WD40 repeat protein